MKLYRTITLDRTHTRTHDSCWFTGIRINFINAYPKCAKDSCEKNAPSATSTENVYILCCARWMQKIYICERHGVVEKRYILKCYVSIFAHASSKHYCIEKEREWMRERKRRERKAHQKHKDYFFLNFWFASLNTIFYFSLLYITQNVNNTRGCMVFKIFICMLNRFLDWCERILWIQYDLKQIHFKWI